MRFESPPTFITSPASRKKGTASSVNELTPLMRRSATTCGWNWSSWNIIATAESSSAKAIGMPISMPPSRAARKMTIVMRFSLAALRRRRHVVVGRDRMQLGRVERLATLGADHHQLVGAKLAGERAIEVGQKDEQRNDAEQDAHSVQPCGRGVEGRRAGVDVDQRLLPAAHEEDRGQAHHQHLRDREAGPLAGARQ